MIFGQITAGMHDDPDGIIFPVGDNYTTRWIFLRLGTNMDARGSFLRAVGGFESSR